MSGLASPALEELINMPYVEAIERLGDRDVTLRVLAPPYAGVGVGSLHVVRCEDKGDSVELVLTYDDYERLDARDQDRATASTDRGIAETADKTT